MSSNARLQSAEWERYRTVRLRALKDSPDAFWMTSEEEEAFEDERWQERLASAATFIVRRESEDVGIVTGAAYEGREGVAGLFGMWVAPAARGTGVADLLVDEVVRWARDEDFERLVLDVADDNARAIRLYERKGFLPTGRTAHMPEPREHITEHERSLEL